MKQGWMLRLATWSLHHLVPRRRVSDAMNGDMLEEWQGGRSSGWYCRQVAAALLAAWAAELHRMRYALLFALLWSLPVPLLSFNVYPSEVGLWLFEKTIQLPWPTSFICWIGLCLMTGIFYAWLGAATCLLVRSLALRRFDWGGFRLAFPIAIVLYVFATAITLGLISLTHFPPIRVGSLNAVRFVTDPRFLLMRLPTVISLFCAVYGAVSKGRSESRGSAVVLPPPAH
jgi:hypothetical protein